MNIKSSMKNTKKSIKAFAKLYNAPCNTKDFETFMEFPEKIEKKSMRLFEVRPGLELLIENMLPLEKHVADIEEDGSQLIFSFFVSGKVRAVFRGQQNDFIISKRQNILCFTPRSIQTMELLPGENFCLVNIKIEHSFLLNNFIEGKIDRIQTDIYSIIEDSIRGNYLGRTGFMTPPMHIAIHQILNCPYHGVIKQMYIESKAIELITHQLAQLVLQESSTKTRPVLHRDDIERIHFAREILVENLQNPPAVYKLSRMVGLNELKLQQGFRRIYGKTVFACFRGYQFEKARCLLREDDMNVAEVAYKLGYSKVDNFAVSFKKLFGVSPGTYRRNI